MIRGVCGGVATYDDVLRPVLGSDVGVVVMLIVMGDVVVPSWGEAGVWPWKRRVHRKGGHECAHGGHECHGGGMQTRRRNLADGLAVLS